MSRSVKERFIDREGMRMDAREFDIVGRIVSNDPNSSKFLKNSTGTVVRLSSLSDEVIDELYKFFSNRK